MPSVMPLCCGWCGFYVRRGQKVAWICHGSHLASTTFATAQIAAILSDGIGPEVIAASREVFKVCAERDGGFELEVTDFDWGSAYYKKHGVRWPNRTSAASAPPWSSRPSSTSRAG